MATRVPAWFTAERYANRYAALSVLSHNDRCRLWLHWLTKCRDLRTLGAGDWGALAKAAGKDFPRDGRPPSDVGFTMGYLSVPPIEILAAEGFEHPLRDYPSFGTPMFLCVNLDAPDEMLRAAFEEALSRARDRHPIAVKRRGRKRGAISAPQRITPQKLSEWQSAKICEVAELDWWALQQDPRPTGADLARCIFGECDQLSKQMNSARRILATALSSIPVLWAECLSLAARVADNSDPASEN